MANVLIVEDESLIRMTLCDCFEDAGLHFTEAADADSALSLLDDGAKDIVVLVTDLNLGPGLNGLQIAAEARRRLPKLQVVYATGNPDWLADRPLQPWERLFVKPFDPTALVEEVQALLAAQGRA